MGLLCKTAIINEMWQDFKNIYHLFKAVFANLYFKFPSRNMKVVGITGTDGKTTTSHLLYHILKNEGLKVALISTVSALIDGKEYDTGFHVTTPDSFQIQRYISLAQRAKCEYLLLEVTSHALDQNRVFGIHFAIGILTNVSHEHLDYHKTYENYVKTKFKLLRHADSVVVNSDDKSYRFISKLRKTFSSQQWITYGFHDAEITLKEYPFVKTLPGEYNWSNGLAAVAAAKLLGIAVSELKSAFASFSLPKGRLEVVYDKDFQVIIDFAHTPNSLEHVLQSMKERTKGRLIHVFGSAGHRDSSKRPLMGKASSEYADISILTAEDPRGESVEKISDEIKSGMSKKNDETVVVIADRRDAITAAISMARKQDTVIITGKGHERSMNYGNGEVAWSDVEAVNKAL